MSDHLLAQSIKWLAKQFTEAAAGRPLTIEPAVAATYALALDMAGARLDETTELMDSDDRLRNELRIAEAEIAHLKLRLTIAEVLAGGRSPAPVSPSDLPNLRCRSVVLPSDASIAAAYALYRYDAVGDGRDRKAKDRDDENRRGTATVIHLEEAFRREHRVAGRPIGPDGGAA